MRVIACWLLTLFVSSAFLGVCSGAVWFEGYNPQDSQEIRLLNVEHKIPAVSPYTATPVCDLILSEVESQIVNLNIIVTTWALGHQTGNFETWLSLDDQEPEKLFGTLDITGSAAGEFYKRQYDVTLSGLGDGMHLIKIRVAGTYYGPGSGNYDCEGNATVIVDSILPTVSFESAMNKTFNNGNITLDFTANKPLSKVIYSLDNQQNQTADANSPLSLNNLPNGKHKVTIFGQDEYGLIGHPSTVYFSVDVFPTLYIAAISSLVLVIILVTGLLVYHKKQTNLVKKV
jgi:hypothetical protein